MPKEKIAISFEETHSIHVFYKRYFIKCKEKILDFPFVQVSIEIFVWFLEVGGYGTYRMEVPLPLPIPSIFITG